MAIGTYKGIEIQEGDDASVAKQVADINSSQNMVTSESLQDVREFEIPQTTPDTTISGELAGLESQTKDQTDRFNRDLQTEKGETKKLAQGSMEDYFRGILDAPTQSELESKEFAKEGGVDEIQTELVDINSQLRAEQQALRRQVEEIQSGAGTATKAQRDMSASEAQRTSLRKQADLAVIQQSIQGRFDSAKAIADRAVNAQMEYEQRKIDVLGAIYERNKSLFDKSEQRAFESAQADRQRKLDEEAVNKQNIYTLGLTVGQNGGGSQLMQQVLSAKTPQDAIVAAGDYLSDPLDRAYKQAQINDIYSNMSPATNSMITPGTIDTETASRVNDINNVLQNPYFDSAFGVTGLFSGIVPGSPVITVRSQIQQVIDTAALAARGKLKGQGTVSDFEGKMLANAQTALKFTQNANDARKELAKIRGAITTSSGGKAPVLIIAPNGQTKEGMANSQEITEAINNGYVVQYQ